MGDLQPLLAKPIIMSLQFLALHCMYCQALSYDVGSKCGLCFVLKQICLFIFLKSFCLVLHKSHFKDKVNWFALSAARGNTHSAYVGKHSL